MNEPVATGTIIARATDHFDNELVTAAITMTADAWNKLTAGYKGFHRWLTDNPAIPDLSLEERIEEFLRQETAVWDYDGMQSHFGGDLDDDVPF